MIHLQGEYAAEFEEQKRIIESRYSCDHSGSVEARRRILRDGNVTVYRQCCVCGEGFGAAKKSSFTDMEIAGLAPYDEDLRSQRYLELREELAEIHRGILACQTKAYETKDSEWWTWYNSYLASPEWFQKRELVFHRAGRMCEGCGMKRAQQVHHLTYKHVGNEFLFELVAVCNVCHERLHEGELNREKSSASR